ncbi:hypothetical protein QZH41_004879, partial [Actinostola sp. cb2023]
CISTMVLKRIIKRSVFAADDDAEIKENKSPERLFSINFCPSWLQFNKFVLSGYRCNLSTSECLMSLTYLHNESINIYSHGIPFLVFVLFIPLTASEACLRAPFWFSFHYIACFVPMFASLIYHLFMCHHNVVVDDSKLGLRNTNFCYVFDGMKTVNFRKR